MLVVLSAVTAACGAPSPDPGPSAPTSADRSCGGLLTREECAVLGDGVSPRQGGAWGWDDVEVVPARGSGSATALRVRYPAGSASQSSHRDSGSPTGGAQVYLPLDEGGRDALRLSYSVRFEPGFDFNKGGKLPGLYGGTRTSGGMTPDGTDGLSTRLMWRRGGAGEVYAYLPSSEEHGTSLGRGAWTFEPGRWYRVEQEVRLNDVGRKNGQILLDVDGRRVLSERGLEFRTTDDLRIDGVFFSTFFGGDDRSWASPRDQYADFTGFAVAAPDG